MSTLLLEPHNGVLHITLNRPECRNAMSLEMVNELRAVVAQLDDQVRAVVLSGAGGHFCAGADVKDLVSAGDQLQALNRAFGTLLQEVEAVSQVVIVVLQGAVLGGGLGLACVSTSRLPITRRSSVCRKPAWGCCRRRLRRLWSSGSV